MTAGGNSMGIGGKGFSIFQGVELVMNEYYGYDDSVWWYVSMLTRLWKWINIAISKFSIT